MPILFALKISEPNGMRMLLWSVPRPMLFHHIHFINANRTKTIGDARLHRINGGDC